jgi:hypothetical protein
MPAQFDTLTPSRSGRGIPLEKQNAVHFHFLVSVGSLV